MQKTATTWISHCALCLDCADPSLDSTSTNSKWMDSCCYLWHHFALLFTCALRTRTLRPTSRHFARISHSWACGGHGGSFWATYLSWIGSWSLKIREKFEVLAMLWRFGSEKKWLRNKVQSNGTCFYSNRQKRWEDMKTVCSCILKRLTKFSTKIAGLLEYQASLQPSRSQVLITDISISCFSGMYLIPVWAILPKSCMGYCTYVLREKISLNPVWLIAPNSCKRS